MTRILHLAATAALALIAAAPAAAQIQQSQAGNSPYRYFVTGYGQQAAQEQGCPPASEPRGGLREEFHQSYPLTPGGRVALKNVNGGACVTVWDRSEVRVDALKSASSQEELSATGIIVDARPDSVDIRSDCRRDCANVQYVVTVPRRAQLDSVELVNGGLTVIGVEGRVRANTVNGGITANGLAGEVNLASVNGGVSSQFSRLDAETRVTLRSVNGGIDTALPATAGSRVKASTVHGGIENDFNLPVNREVVGQQLEGTIGAGGASLEVQTVNGGIRIRRR